MINTIKFSQFPEANLSDSTAENVGIASGVNIKSPKVVTWTTATRPLTPFNGLLGFNTTEQQYEYWDASLNAWLQLLTSNTGIDWSIITAVSQNASVNNGYITNRAATPVSILLPALFMPGDIVEVMGLGAGGWSLVANLGQNIQWASVSTSVDGSINSDIQYANITVRGLVENTTWSVISVNSNPTYL